MLFLEDLQATHQTVLQLIYKINKIFNKNCLTIHSIIILDINKFLWMVRIGGSTEKGKSITEWDYYNSAGEFRVDKEGSPILLNCLMYKMCYYRFGQVYTEGGKVFSNLLLLIFEYKYNFNDFILTILYYRQTIWIRSS